MDLEGQVQSAINPEPVRLAEMSAVIVHLTAISRIGRAATLTAFLQARGSVIETFSNRQNLGKGRKRRRESKQKLSDDTVQEKGTSLGV